MDSCFVFLPQPQKAIQSPKKTIQRPEILKKTNNDYTKPQNTIQNVQHIKNQNILDKNQKHQTRVATHMHLANNIKLQIFL